MDMPESKYKKLAVVVLAALVVIIVIAGVALFSRGGGNPPVRIILPTPQDSAGGNARAGTESSQTTEAEPDLQVYVSGAVRRPGGYTLKPGDRLIDALEAAGGSIPEADLEAVNLALRVQDEAQYKIPRMGDTPDPESNVVSALAASQKPLSDKGQSSGGLIELNKASAELLETLPGIGPVRAGDIVADRELNGPFLSIEQITRVQGIGPAILGEIRELVTVGEGP